MQPVTSQRVLVRPDLLSRAFRIGLGALVIALSAQIALPMSFTPIPFTLQPLAVILVGAWLGPVEGATALGAYLVAGALGAPVFAMGHGGAWRLVGPTGGYLLAFPVAAAVAGLARTRGLTGVALAGWSALVFTVAMAVIHLGGVSQLALLGGDPGLAFRSGFLPFFIGDLLKVAIATAVIVVSGTRLTAQR
ncbi:MAG TPA: biotin transporter BioY [Gemmatimonadales bacterium]|jgi:biotin transport system substrate-specific component|nr:biotin transporter BioY [Gemmatimonadales bacterium]